MYILVDEKNIIVACSNNPISAVKDGYIVDGVLYLKNNLTPQISDHVTADCVQKKCFCKQYKNCFGESCPYYNECHATGVNTAVYTNKSYGEVSSREGKELIVEQLKVINPELDVAVDDIFPVIADKIDIMLDDATASTEDIRRDDTAYTGYGKQTGAARVIDTYNSLLNVNIDALVDGDIIEVKNSTYLVTYQLYGSEYGSINKTDNTSENHLPNEQIILTATVKKGDVGNFFAGWYKNEVTSDALLSTEPNYTFVTSHENVTIIAAFNNYANV